MNKIYKVVWSKVKNCYVVVSEIAKNVITGGVKSTKVGKAPLANGLALGAVMAFVITGNVWAAQQVDGEPRYASSLTYPSETLESLTVNTYYKNGSPDTTLVYTANGHSLIVNGDATIGTSVSGVKESDLTGVYATSGSTAVFGAIGSQAVTDIDVVVEQGGLGITNGIYAAGLDTSVTANGATFDMSVESQNGSAVGIWTDTYGSRDTPDLGNDVLTKVAYRHGYWYHSF